MEVFRNIAVVLVIINFVLYATTTLLYKQTKPIRIFTLHLFLIFAVEMVVSYYASEGWNNIFLSHIYFINQFLVLSWFYYTLFTKKQKKGVLIIGALVITALLTQYVVDTDVFWRFNLFEVLITSLPLILYSLIHLYNSLAIKGKYLFINASILIYLSVSTIIFFFGNYTNLNSEGIEVKDQVLPFDIWELNVLLLIINRLLIFWEWAFTKSVCKTKQA